MDAIAAEGRPNLLQAICIPTAERRPSLKELALTVALVSPVFGLAMGCFDLTGNRWLYAVFSAVKMPVMVATTWAVCLPGFIALCSVLGLRSDLRECLRAIACGQAAVAFGLASLAPVLLFAYASGVSHRWALLLSGGMFAVATLMGQVVMLRRWRPLIARGDGAAGRHRLLLLYWLAAYVFVGIQTGWMLRPFVGSPGIEPAFLRAEPFSNAYVVVTELITGTRR
ncbi:MAG TPA: hypothetical protein VFF65_11150 [Phycisphaerales bacterium]|nr:hypothetical protein [Phycisphaerales bacterium]